MCGFSGTHHQPSAFGVPSAASPGEREHNPNPQGPSADRRREGLAELDSKGFRSLSDPGLTLSSSSVRPGTADSSQKVLLYRSYVPVP